MKVTKIAHIEWDFKDDNDPDLRWCQDTATFAHRSACEFIFAQQDIAALVQDMTANGCSARFIEVFEAHGKAMEDDGWLLVWC